MYLDDEKFEIMYRNIEEIHDNLIKNDVTYEGICGMEAALNKVKSMFGKDISVQKALEELDIIKRM